MSATVVPIDTPSWKISTVLPAAPAVPLSVSVLSLVRWSPTVPLSTENAVIDGATGATVSTVTRNAVEFGPGLPAASVSAAVTSNVPSPCAVIVAGGTVTVALLAETSPARSV